MPDVPARETGYVFRSRVSWTYSANRACPNAATRLSLKTVPSASMTLDHSLQRQRAAVAALRAKQHRMPLVNSEIFVLSARSSGYRSTATAVDEFIDNSIQADAGQVDIVLGYADLAASTRNLRTNGVLAIADNGHGMDPEVIRFAVTWGGTHRHNDRSGFGRYGFGLPAAAASIGTRFSEGVEEWQLARGREPVRSCGYHSTRLPEPCPDLSATATTPT